MFVLFATLIITVALTARKHWRSYKQGNITRNVVMRNMLLDIFGILLAMTLAGLFGRHIAEIATEQINNDLTKLIAGVVIGLVVGIGIGLL